MASYSLTYSRISTKKYGAFLKTDEMIISYLVFFLVESLVVVELWAFATNQSAAYTRKKGVREKA